MILNRHRSLLQYRSLPLDILPALKREDSPKGIFRLRVSSVAKYAFASHVDGRRPVVSTDVVCSAYSPVKGASDARSALRRDEYFSSLHGGVFSPHGTTIRVARSVTSWIGSVGFVTTREVRAKLWFRRRRRFSAWELRDRHTREKVV